MYLSPSGQKRGPPFGHKVHGAANLIALHAYGPNQLRRASRAGEIDLRLPVAEHMNVGRLVVVAEYDDAQAMRTVDRDH
jgi:hypothetical protein